MEKLVWILLLFLQEAHWVQPYSSMVGRRGDELRIELRMIIDEGYHIQHEAPNDPSLIPTHLTLELPHGWEIISTQYPPSESITLHGEEDAMKVYSGEVMFVIRINTHGQEAMVPDIRAILNYQACDDRKCYFPRTLEFFIDI